MASARAAAQKQTTESFNEAWKKLSIEGIVATRTPDCIQFTLPRKSLSYGEMSNEKFAATIGPMFGVLSNFEIDIHSVTHDFEAGRSIVHASTAADTPVGPYRNEHISILWFTEDGEKVAKFEDMMDSHFVLGLQERMAEYLKKQTQA